AIAPGVAAMRIVLEAVSVRKADDIQPVLPPALSVMRAGQQPVNDFLISVRRSVANESIHFGWRRWQSGKVEGQTTDENRTRRGRRGVQPLSLQASQHECVDRSFRPSTIRRIRELRDRRIRPRLKRPVLALDR